MYLNIIEYKVKKSLLNADRYKILVFEKNQKKY